MRSELDPPLATGELLGRTVGAGAVVALCVTDGWAVAVGGTLPLGETLALGEMLAAAAGGTLAARLGEKLMLLLGARLAIAPPPLPPLPHPVTEHAAPMIVAARSGPLTAKCLMPILPRIRNPSRARTSPKGGAAGATGHHPLGGRPLYSRR
jgi:hypothetical protein